MSTSSAQRAPVQGTRPLRSQLEVLVLPLDGRLAGFRVYCAEIASDGIFIPTTRPLRLDTLLRLKVVARGGATLKVTARVVHLVPGQGLGLEFLDVDTHTQCALVRLVAESKGLRPRSGTIHVKSDATPTARRRRRPR